MRDFIQRNLTPYAGGPDFLADPASRTTPPFRTGRGTAACPSSPAQLVLDIYPPAVHSARSSRLVAGLSDTHGRGRIIGDYRRIALYGVDELIAAKNRDKRELDALPFSESVAREREELADQIRALGDLAETAAVRGHDISGPAASAREAALWLWFGHLAAVEENTGAVPSLGRTSTFLDIYLERDLAAGHLTEEAAQQIVDDFVLGARRAHTLHATTDDALPAEAPARVTETIGGMSEDGRTLVTRTSFRFLHSLHDLAPEADPAMTVLWSPRQPQDFRDYCAEVSEGTSAVRFESDDRIRSGWGDDAAVAGCVPPVAIGRQVQFFGGRVNLAKALLHALNGGRDEVTGAQVSPAFLSVEPGVPLDPTDVRARFDHVTEWLAGTYAEALNYLHWSHDAHAYERIGMALHDTDVLRSMTCGISGLEVAAASLAALDRTPVLPVFDTRDLVVDFEFEEGRPDLGDDDRVEEIASELLESFMEKFRRHRMYRDAVPTPSVLSGRWSTVDGAATGATPDGRPAGAPFLARSSTAPGA